MEGRPLAGLSESRGVARSSRLAGGDRVGARSCQLFRGEPWCGHQFVGQQLASLDLIEVPRMRCCVCVCFCCQTKIVRDTK